MSQSRPLLCLFSFYINYKTLKKAQMFCIGFEPMAASCRCRRILWAMLAKYQTLLNTFLSLSLSLSLSLLCFNNIRIYWIGITGWLLYYFSTAERASSLLCKPWVWFLERKKVFLFKKKDGPNRAKCQRWRWDQNTSSKKLNFVPWGLVEASKNIKLLAVTWQAKIEEIPSRFLVSIGY